MKKKDIFTPGMFRRLLVPSLFSSVGLAFANMADAVVVGRRMGTVGLAAISLCLPFYMILNVFMHGLGIAVGILASLLFVLRFDLGIKGAAWAALLGIAVPTICYLPGILHHKSGEKKVLRLSLPSICAGEEGVAFLLAFLRGFAVLLPCTILFSFTALHSFFWLYLVCESVSLAVFFLWRKCTGKKVLDFDEKRVFIATIQGQNEDITGLTEEVGNFCEQWNGQPRQTYFVMMAVEEICMAIAAGNRRKDGSVALQITLIALPQGDFELHFRDNTELFDPFSLHSARAGEQSGFDMDALGVTIVKQQAKDYFYRNYQGFNSLVVRI